jgi:hypothetical protein
VEFEAFPKLPRLNRGMVISEKLDGTNACVVVQAVGIDSQVDAQGLARIEDFPQHGSAVELFAQSRKRLIALDQDNYGFARWVQNHAGDLAQLGEGRHFGEWWGLGIQRGYDQDRKRFSLFNTSRWADNPERPECCDVVPVLATADFSQDRIADELEKLGAFGSVAAPGFMNPEGVVVYLSSARSMFKVTLKDDELPKSVAERQAA